MSNLEQQLQLQADTEAIRRLKHYNYCHCIDRAVAGDTAAMEQATGRFADGIVADFSGFSPAEGNDAVTEFFTVGVPSMLSYSQHQVFNEVIDIDGDHASGLWYLHCPVNFTAASPLGKAGPGLIMGRYEEEYVRVDGLWKWRRIVALLDVIAGTEAPWSGVSQLMNNRGEAQ